jgi:hypothetical protein
VNQENALEAPTRGEQVRSLGFDPDYLTAEEQEELLAIEALLCFSGQETDPILVRL